MREAKADGSGKLTPQGPDLSLFAGGVAVTVVNQRPETVQLESNDGMRATPAGQSTQ